MHIALWILLPVVGATAGFTGCTFPVGASSSPQRMLFGWLPMAGAGARIKFLFGSRRPW